MYKIELSPTAKNDFRSLKIGKGRNIVATAVEDLKFFPLQGKILTRELTGQRVLKVNGYRIIYIIKQKDKLINVIRIKHRSIAYN